MKSNENSSTYIAMRFCKKNICNRSSTSKKNSYSYQTFCSLHVQKKMLYLHRMKKKKNELHPNFDSGKKRSKEVHRLHETHDIPNCSCTNARELAVNRILSIYLLLALFLVSTVHSLKGRQKSRT